MDIETLQIPRRHIEATRATYSVQAKHPHTGDVVRESHDTMNAAATSAAALLQAGYSIEIWSAMSLEERRGHS